MPTILTFSAQTFVFDIPMHRCAPDRDRDAIGVGSSYHAFESGHSTPLSGRILAETLVNTVAAM
jgi:hypothetical protein